MLRRIAIVAVIASAFIGGTYTTLGCGGESVSPTEPKLPAQVSGTVTDAATGAPISGALVEIQQGNLVYTGGTAQNGTYQLQAGFIGAVTVTARANGYQTFTTQFQLLNGSNRLDIKMSR